MLGKSLQDSANNHDDGTDEDGHTSTIALVQPWGNRDGENGTELVASRHETDDFGVDGVLSILVEVAVSKVYLC